MSVDLEYVLVAAKEPVIALFMPKDLLMLSVLNKSLFSIFSDAANIKHKELIRKIQCNKRLNKSLILRLYRVVKLANKHKEMGVSDIGEVLLKGTFPSFLHVHTKNSPDYVMQRVRGFSPENPSLRGRTDGECHEVNMWSLVDWALYIMYTILSTRDAYLNIADVSLVHPRDMYHYLYTPKPKCFGTYWHHR